MQDVRSKKEEGRFKKEEGTILPVLQSVAEIVRPYGMMPGRNLFRRFYSGSCR